ncbi:hypothetical protein [Eremococcus coleocola]|uniref:Uncharacterized protein n=1 Tax=Eremococcus coleocola ACS-139-V-Col8 TaxID=908337 RepID=E4KQF6_9LACT|nr:hypothetical protein [Eremococcus coleocola]EFR30579.1 hypothetical protein HMPREF9257_0512 [Eremococcus coleocola ACS-139-V-Col8]
MLEWELPSNKDSTNELYGKPVDSSEPANQSIIGIEGFSSAY